MITKLLDDNYPDTGGKWDRTGYEIPEESMKQDEVALSVEVEHEEKKQANS